MNAKVWTVCLAQALLFAILLFGSAGTFRWAAAWVYLAIFLASTLLITWMLARDDPALLKERMKSPIQKDQPLWDKLILASTLLLFPVWFILMGLDAKRFHWSHMPIWLQAIGAIGTAPVDGNVLSGLSGKYLSRACGQNSGGSRSSGRLDRPLSFRPTSLVRGRHVLHSGDRALARLLVGLGDIDRDLRYDRASHDARRSRASSLTRRLPGVRGARSLSAGADDLVKAAHHLATIGKTIAPRRPSRPIAAVWSKRSPRRRSGRTRSSRRRTIAPAVLKTLGDWLSKQTDK